MDKEINVLELLKDCPKGMELDCTLCDNVTFDGIDGNNLLVKRKSDGNKICLSKWGTFFGCNDAKCVIFPKGKTTWDGFQKPFKDGDIIFTHANCLKVGVGNTWISIFQEKRNGGVATYVDYAEDGSDYYSNIDGDKALLCMENDILRQRLATEEEKQKLFDAIKAHGYKWNTETKTLEKLVDDNSSCTATHEDCPFGAEQLLLARDVIKWLAENRCASINTINLFESAAGICFNIARKKVTEKETIVK